MEGKCVIPQDRYGGGEKRECLAVTAHSLALIHPHVVTGWGLIIYHKYPILSEGDNEVMVDVDVANITNEFEDREVRVKKANG